MTYVVGLTGGIGTGKTAVSDAFQALGITVADADIAARDVVMPGTQALISIRHHFGDQVIQPDGTLDRAQMRERVFKDPQQRQWLEALTVPLIMSRLKHILTHSTSPYALLVLSSGRGQHPLIHRNLVVDAAPEEQLARVTQRDQSDPATTQAIMGLQPSRQERLAYADDVIANRGTLAALTQQVKMLHVQYLSLSTAHTGEHHA